MKEIWKYIPGYDGLYSVSNFGRIRAEQRKLPRWGRGGCCIAEQKIIRRQRGTMLSWKRVRRIRRMYRTGQYTMQELGSRFGVSPPTICLIVNHKTWKRRSR